MSEPMHVAPWAEGQERILWESAPWAALRFLAHLIHCVENEPDDLVLVPDWSPPQNPPARA